MYTYVYIRYIDCIYCYICMCVYTYENRSLIKIFETHIESYIDLYVY